MTSPRALVVDHRPPRPDRDARSARVLYLIRSLQALGARVTFLPLDLLRDWESGALEEAGVEVCSRDTCTSIEDHLEGHGTDYRAVLLVDPELAASFMQAVRAHCPKAVILLDLAAAGSLGEGGDGQAVARGPAARLIEVAAQADRVLVSAEADRELLQRAAPGPEARVVLEGDPESARSALASVLAPARPAAAPAGGEERGVDDAPEISIIIPVFGRVELTQRCLETLQAHQSRWRFEVLVVDDGSTDATPERIGTLPWLRYFRQERNRGFGFACNHGARQARGQYLVFLNNDIEVCDGWLDVLRETFDIWPQAGLVGSKLVWMDGRLQECGGLVFRDGSAANYGRGGDPADPRYSFCRQTDYVSGAAMMIRRDLFLGLGGFDRRYEPAYYEDTDLAFQVRRQGLQVIVNAHAEVRHHEGATAGTDLGRGVKRFQVVNQEKFRHRWREELRRQPPRPRGGAQLPRQGPRVLVVDWIVPRPDRDSGSLRMTGLLRALRNLGCQVTLAAQDLSCEPGYERPLERIGVEVLRRPWVASLEAWLERHGAGLDHVILSRRDAAAGVIDAVERTCPEARLVFDTCDLHFVREARQAETGASGVEAAELEKNRGVELDLVRRSDVALVVSPEEKRALEELLPGQDVRIVSNILERRPTPKGFAQREGVLFIGFFQHPPNPDGVLWFAREVLPELDRLGLRPTFHVVGSDPTEEVQALASERIRIHGYVPDVEPLFDSCRLSVAPLRFGAGVKGKINQSMALGVPCVTTRIGAEGTFIQDGVDGLVADEAAEFAAKIAAAYRDEALWAKLREGGLRNVREHFSLEVATEALRGLVSEHERDSGLALPIAGSVAGPQTEDVPKLIAFYLPQFHPTPENDRFWGKGFTEWTNVTRARPLFEGHHQPRLPADLGFYDLRVPEVREAQAELARAHGIHGFCYHYYWFDRTRLLHRPLDEVLESGRPDFPFCICWANESWSRRWDGSEDEVLVAQDYRPGFAERFAEDVAPLLLDPRYIRLRGRPVLVVYRLDQIPDPERTVDTWRTAFRRLGVGEVFLVAVEFLQPTDPTVLGFDAAVEFPPHNPSPVEYANTPAEQLEQRRSVRGLDPEFEGLLRDYRVCARERASRKLPGYPLFRCVMPSWDNAARAGRRAMVYREASPEVYREWLEAALASAAEHAAPHPPLTFVNAWNEWAEGTYLEPDQGNGSAYLAATAEAMQFFRTKRHRVGRLSSLRARRGPEATVHSIGTAGR